MKFNGTIFSKPQQDQLKENIGNELEKVSIKIDEIDARLLNYKGDWVTGDEYREKDIVTGEDGQLYEVIKAHTSSNILKPGNTEYYKAMTSTKLTSKTYTVNSESERTRLVDDVKNAILNHKRAVTLFTYGTGKYLCTWEFYTSSSPNAVYGGCVAGTHDTCTICKIYVDINDRAMYLYTISSSGTITVSNVPLFNSLTVVFEQ